MQESKNMFEIAVRGKFRFPHNGMISVEELWELPVTKLDSIFKTLNSQLKQVKEESLLETKTKEDQELDIKIEIVKYIVKVKLDEEDMRLKAKEVKEQKQKLYGYLAEKQDNDLRNKSVKELTAMINALENQQN